MLTNYPNGVASFGVPVLPGLPATTGSVWFVDSATGADGNDGYGPDSAMATIDAAIGKCTANKGDVILVMPGHAETITAAGGITLDVAGVSIIGLGVFTLKPTITLGTATTADVNITAANCRISNIRFVSNINSLGNFLDVDAGQFMVDNCDFITSSAKEAVNFINLATTKDDFIIRDCTFLQPTDPEGTGGAANTGAIYCVDSENILIEGCKFRGQFESAIVHNKTTACKGLVVKDCELSNELTVPFLLVTTAEGVCERCYGATLVASDASEAQVFGTIGTLFWISQSTSLGNDSGGGGQGSVTGTVAS